MTSQSTGAGLTVDGFVPRGRTFVDADDAEDVETVHGLQDSSGLTRQRSARSTFQHGIRHLLVTAGGWGGNPARDAFYLPVFVDRNDGTTVHRLTVRDVPADGFWSLSVYNRDRYFAKNPENIHSVNNVSARASDDGSVTIQFGGLVGTAANRLPIMPGWNYLVRLYRPRPEVLDGSWTFPRAEGVLS